MSVHLPIWPPGRSLGRRTLFARLALTLAMFLTVTSAQFQTRPAPNPSAQLTGTLKDTAGYLIPHATLTLTPVPSPTAPSTTPITVSSDEAGFFRFPRLEPGAYLLTAQALGFAPLQQSLVVGGRGEPQRLTLVLQLPLAETHLDVPADTAADASPENNGSALILHAADLAALSDDPDTMRRQLEAIAGPSPDGIKFFVDGFEATRLPPKSDIREVRMNSNLYSAQYESSGQGRVEVFTRAGAGTLHGGFWISAANSLFNAQDPFLRQPAYASSEYNGFLSGPLGKRLSTNLNFYRLAHNDSAIVNATILDANLNPAPFLQALPDGRTQNFFSPRLDFQAPHNTAVSLRYVFSYDTQAIGGVGGLALASQAYRLQNTNQILQLLATNSFGAKTVNEVRFQYTRTRNNQFALSTAPTIAVQGAFTSGGATAGTNRDKVDTYELQDYFSHVFKTSFLRSGGRLRLLREANFATSNFNGQYTFPTLAAYQATLRGLAQGLTPAQIRASGGGASLFSLAAGTPAAVASRMDAALYAEDDWKITPRFTASLGLRLETQDVIADHLDAAPRASLTYAVGRVGKPSRFTLRAGAGLFYQRFAIASQLRAARQNGILQQQYQVQNPDFYPALPTPALLGASLPSTIYQISPSLRTPMSLYTGAGIDHAFGKTANLSLSYSMTHLMHAFEIRNVNAPLPGTYNPAVPNSGTRSLPGLSDIYQYGSEGVSNQHALRLNGGYRKGPIGLYAYYTYTRTNADTGGGFPSDSFNQHIDYGRADNDLRHQVYAYMNTALPFKFQMNTSLLAHSGAPFNIVLGQDLNGDTQFNDRPTFATDLTRPSVVATRWGIFDTAPLPGQRTIPINLGTSPFIFQLDQRLSRTIPFGPRLPSPPEAKPAIAGRTAPANAQPIRRRYSLEFTIYAENILNKVNLAPPNGTLNSPLFGRSTSAQGPRQLNFGLSFNF